MTTYQEIGNNTDFLRQLFKDNGATDLLFDEGFSLDTASLETNSVEKSTSMNLHGRAKTRLSGLEVHLCLVEQDDGSLQVTASNDSKSLTKDYQTVKIDDITGRVGYAIWATIRLFVQKHYRVVNK